jgi:amidohydrolase
MVDDGLFERFGRPAVVLGQHVAPLPAGVIGLRHGAAFAAADVLSIVLHGRGGHGSRPETSVDPVVMAAATVMRLQTIVSRELAGNDTAVVTIGSVQAGTAANIIPDRAELQLSIRTTGADVRTRVLAAVERIVRGEAVAAGAPRDPEITLGPSFPAVVNDPDAASLTQPALEAVSQMVVDPGPVTASEDVGVLATAAGAPCVFWLLGGADPAGFEERPRWKRSQPRCSSCHRTTPRCTPPRSCRPSTSVPQPSWPLPGSGSAKADAQTGACHLVYAAGLRRPRRGTTTR